MNYPSSIEQTILSKKYNKILTLTCRNKSISAIEFVDNHRRSILSSTLEHGGVLMRGFSVESISDFNKVANHLLDNLLEYAYCSTPRTMIGGRIYTATEYPPERTILQHNENSYTNKWPMHLLFFCSIPALRGGQTTLSDSKIVYQLLDQTIIDTFERHQILYVRNYYPNFDLDWRSVFNTHDPSAVEKYCAANNIAYNWRSNQPELTTKQLSQATIQHPITKERLWFNQAHLFNVKSLPLEDKNLLSQQFPPQYLPRNSYYGNGDEITTDTLEAINNAYLEASFEFTWERGDILMIDNLLIAHGRKPFQGERRLLVAMN